MQRRQFSKDLLATVSSFLFIESIFATEAISRPIRPITDHWALRLHEYCSDLKKASLSTLEWQSKVEDLYAEIELEEVLRFINFKQLSKGFIYPDLGVNTRRVQFPKLSGLPERTVFHKKIFGMKKGRAIIPHGHSNMASAHLLLKGDVHLRHYEKLAQSNQHLHIRPSIDTHLKAGQHSSISDEKDNIHWFIAETEAAFTFDVIMLDLAGRSYDIHNLDMFESEKQSDGSLRVPILDVETALKKYGKNMHH